MQPRFKKKKKFKLIRDNKRKRETGYHLSKYRIKDRWFIQESSRSVPADTPGIIKLITLKTCVSGVIVLPPSHHSALGSEFDWITYYCMREPLKTNTCVKIKIKREIRRTIKPEASFLPLYLQTMRWACERCGRASLSFLILSIL